MNPIIRKISASNETSPENSDERSKLRAELLQMILRKEAERKMHTLPHKNHSTMQAPHISLRS